MPRNNRLVALHRWRNARRRDGEYFASVRHLRYEKAALCGFLAGDGHVGYLRTNGRLRCSLQFFPDDEVMRATYVSFLKALYGHEPHCQAQKGFVRVELRHRFIVEDLLSETTFGIRTWRPPDFVLRAPDLMRAWLKAFFSAEGYVGASSIRVQTVNAAGMRAVSAMLQALGIEHRVYTYVPKNTHSAPVHIITILKYAARQEYSAQIGFWHARKTGKLTLALNTHGGFAAS